MILTLYKFNTMKKCSVNEIARRGSPSELTFLRIVLNCCFLLMSQVMLLQLRVNNLAAVSILTLHVLVFEIYEKT